MEYVVKQNIKINAKPAQVWDALTDPKKTKKYFFNAKVLSKWKEGSSITFKGRMFLIIKFEMTGKILEIKPEKLLKYTLRNGSDKKSNSFSTVTDKLTYSKGVTTLSITDDVGKGEGAEKRYKRSTKGWKKVLKGLKKLVEEGN
ncbi:SRPBCC domain-containing protein [Pedobacter boryungensis]|uniref:SRPBCC domain-containing protein n=1 Tax=Pedobacter boryungensis TaxID=869962 RepID=A0ABX2DGK1_9SPHI|nr:SRPBCC domain-containing protein [Pedobacter boryungensis]NQX32081.1 SRPBCC domain-containing protein [Pedobacter boryungensis]